MSGPAGSVATAGEARTRQAAAAGGTPDRSATADQPAPRTRATAERAVGALLAGGVALAASGPIRDNSLLTHIATGRLQVSGGLPASNPFLVTSTDFPVPSWWWSGILGWVERLAGLGGIRLLTVTAAACLGWLVVRAARPVTAPELPARTALGQALPATVVLALLVPFMNARPHLPGFVLLALSLVIWRERRSPWWLVPVFAFWVNVHGTWLYGIAVLGLSWLAESVDDLRPQTEGPTTENRPPGPPRRLLRLRLRRHGALLIGGPACRRALLDRLRYGVAVLGGLLVGGLWYPERFRLVLLPTEQLGSAEARGAMRMYAEWKPLAVSSPLVWAFAVVVLLALYGVWRRRRVGSAVVVVLLAVMGLGAFRLLPVAAIALAGFGAVGVEAVSFRPPVGLRGQQWMWAAGASALTVAVVLAATGPHVDLTRYPVDEVAWLDERGLVANPDVRLLHNDFVGNYLEFTYGDEAGAWVDDRPSVSTLVDHVSLRTLEGDWDGALSRADPDVVLWRSDDPLPDRLAADDDWSDVLTTDDFRVLCRARIADRCH